MSEPKPDSPRYDALSIDYKKRAGENIAIVKNFPGMFAEMNELELKTIGIAIMSAANKLNVLNKEKGKKENTK